MGRKTRIPSQNKTSKPSVYSKSNIPNNHQHHNQNQKMPSFLGSMAQGAAIGAGASLGSSMINGVMGMGNQNQSNQELNQSNQEFNQSNQEFNQSNQNECNVIFKQFNECATNFNDLNTCKFYLDTFNNCVNYNKKQL